jgi:hypothetical protein
MARGWHVMRGGVDMEKEATAMIDEREWLYTADGAPIGSHDMWSPVLYE